MKMRTAAAPTARTSPAPGLARAAFLATLGALAALAALTLLAAAGNAGEPSEEAWLDRMSAEHAGDTPVASPAAEAAPRLEVVGEPVEYARLGEKGEKAVRGYLTGPKEGDDFAVIVIHEWWGLNDNIRAMADRLAGEGYLALAVDLYEGESATDRVGASRLARGAGERTARVEENLRQAIAFLEGRGAKRIGVIGWCFGGGWSLKTGLLAGDRVHAVVVYYGRVTSDTDSLEPLTAPVLGIFGGQDTGIPVDGVHAFEAALAGLGKPAEIHVYPEAGHAFANPSGSRYRKADAEDAWAKTLAFFARHLRDVPGGGASARAAHLDWESE